MVLCHCQTQTGKPCTREVKIGSEFCWQHQSCQQTININSSKIPLKIKTLAPAFSSEQYNFDWKQTAVEMEMSGYQILKLTKDTIAYSGVSANIPDSTFKGSQYFATLDPALYYGFAGETKRGDRGKVIIVQATKDIYLLDMTNKSNYMKLRTDFSPEQLPLYGKDDVLKWAFDDGNNRESHSSIDEIFSDWLCKNLKLDGWAIRQMKAGSKNWHDEIMICNPSHSLIRLPYEFRATIFRVNKQTWASKIILTYNGKIIRTFEEDPSNKNRIKDLSSQTSIFKEPKGGLDSYFGSLKKISDTYLNEKYPDKSKIYDDSDNED